MAQPADVDTALLTEHFGYPPVSLLDDIINSINILAERALNSVEQGLLNAPPASLGFREHHTSKSKSSKSKSRSKSKSKAAEDEAAQDAADKPQMSFEDAHRHEIENGTHQLETLLCASIDRNFDKLELYVMRNILCVGPEARDWIRLGHYEGLDFGAVLAHKAQAAKAASEAAMENNNGDSSADADRPTPESVHHLRRRVQASQKLNVMLHAEQARNESLLAELRALVGNKDAAQAIKSEDPAAAAAAREAAAKPAPLSFLQNQGDLTEGDAEAPFRTTTAFTLSQLQALRALSTSLRNILPDLEEANATGAGAASDEHEGRKTWRRERLEYVESATRKHLENVRGLELGSIGEVRDGEWQGEGGSVVKGEVESLERVAAMLGGDAPGKQGANQEDVEDAMDES